jgi:hypothetical protein
MSNVNKLTVKTVNHKYVQSGGLFLMAVMKIGEVLLIIVMAVLTFIKNIFKALFMIRWDSNSIFPPTIESGEGMFYKYLWFSIKCGFYLVVFAFGGPLLALVGIIFLYKNLFSKLSELKKEEGEGEGGDGKEENDND